MGERLLVVLGCLRCNGNRETLGVVSLSRAVRVATRVVVARDGVTSRIGWCDVRKGGGADRRGVAVHDSTPPFKPPSLRGGRTVCCWEKKNFIQAWILLSRAVSLFQRDKATRVEVM
jgi:hypothetical protein